MKAIPVYNPSPLGKAFVAPRRAAEYIRKGRAVMRDDGTLQFTLAAQAAILARFEADRAFDESARVNRPHGMFYHNGMFPRGSYPPACNVQVEKPGQSLGVAYDARHILR